MNSTTAQHQIQRLSDALQHVIVGQHEVIHQVVTAVIADGHVLLEGAPGLAKTTLVRSLAQLLSLSFASLILVDEINRTTPRTQSALLEAMQEHTVTVAGTTHPLPDPFMVLATQNPIEMEGTYPLPEAQRDRFLYHIIVPFPNANDLMEIARREAMAFRPQLIACFDAVTLAQVRQIAQQILVADHILAYASQLVLATHPSTPGAPAAVRDGVRYGASPRAVQSLIRTAQVEALRAGRLQVDIADIQRVALPVLRHRIVLRREAFLANENTDSIVALVLAAVPLA